MKLTVHQHLLPRLRMSAVILSQAQELGHEVDRPPTPTTKVKNECSYDYTSLPPICFQEKGQLYFNFPVPFNMLLHWVPPPFLKLPKNLLFIISISKNLT